MTPEQQKVLEAQVLKIMGLVVSHETITNMTLEFILESRKAIKSAIYEAIAIMEEEPPEPPIDFGDNKIYEDESAWMKALAAAPKEAGS